VDTTIDFDEDLCTDHEHMMLGTVPSNNLGGPQGLVFRGTGVVPTEPDQQLELALAVKEGSTYSPGGRQNGKFGEYGIISVKADSEVTLQFTFRDPMSKKPLIQKKSYLSFLDLDAASPLLSSESVFIGDFTTKFLAPQTELLEEDVGSGLRFSATTAGTVLDNPQDPNLLTVGQKKRVVTLGFQDKSVIEATLACSVGPTDCDFMFAVSPSLLCSFTAGKPQDTPMTQTATTTMTSTTSVTTLEAILFCVIDIKSLNIQSICFPEKQWWMFWK